MKTNEELLKMTMDELRVYCSSLKYFTVDKYDYCILTVQDISLINIECFLIHDDIWLKYYLNNDFSEDIYLFFSLQKDFNSPFSSLSHSPFLFMSRRNLKNYQYNRLIVILIVVFCVIDISLLTMGFFFFFVYLCYMYLNLMIYQYQHKY